MTHIILVHGHKSSGDNPRYISLEQELEKRGYSVARFSLKRPVLEDGSQEITSISEELIQVKDFLAEERKNHENIIVVGHLQGGAIVAALAADGLVDGGVSLMGIADSLGRAKHNYERLNTSLELLKSGKYVKRSVAADGYDVTYTGKWFEDLEKWNIPQLFSESKCPLLFIAGTEDKSVFPDEVKSGYDAAAEPKKYILIEGLPHIWELAPGKEADIADAIKRWEESL